MVMSGPKSCHLFVASTSHLYRYRIVTRPKHEQEEKNTTKHGVLVREVRREFSFSQSREFSFSIARMIFSLEITWEETGDD
jgi:hypothetical protein